jgi:hypothetical protein
VLALIILVGFILRVKTYVACGSTEQFVADDGRVLGVCKPILEDLVRLLQMEPG